MKQYSKDQTKRENKGTIPGDAANIIPHTSISLPIDCEMSEKTLITVKELNPSTSAESLINKDFRDSLDQQIKLQKFIILYEPEGDFYRNLLFTKIH